MANACGDPECLYCFGREGTPSKPALGSSKVNAVAAVEFADTIVLTLPKALAAQVFYDLKIANAVRNGDAFDVTLPLAVAQAWCNNFVLDEYPEAATHVLEALGPVAQRIMEKAGFTPVFDVLAQAVQGTMADAVNDGLDGVRS